MTSTFPRPPARPALVPPLPSGYLNSIICFSDPNLGPIQFSGLKGLLLTCRSVWSAAGQLLDEVVGMMSSVKGGTSIEIDHVVCLMIANS